MIWQPALTAPSASFTCTLKLPAEVGVPVTAPVAAFKLSPAGSVPTIEKVYGPVPPVTVIGPLLNETPTSPAVTAAQVTESAALMVIWQPALIAPSASLTCTLNAPGRRRSSRHRAGRRVQGQPGGQRAH